MPLDLYRRHTDTCKHRLKGQYYTGCSCPIWAYGYLNGRRVRRAVGLRDWARAIKRVEAWEDNPKEATFRPSLTIHHCVRAYLADCESRKLAPSTVTSYRKTLDHFEAFCATHGIQDTRGLDLEAFTTFRVWRGVSASTQGKERETLRSFCKFCIKRKWMTENYAAELEVPKDDSPPTMPFEPHEISAMLAAIDRMENKNTAIAEWARLRNRALILLLLYSGLRISDAVKLERSRVDLDSGKILMRMMKTRNAVYVRLHPDAVSALRAIPAKGRYFFWTGTSKLSTAIGNARRSLARLMVLAKVKGHPHRFRDTFAVELLKAGEDIRTVQLLLGHTSIKTTEKHYAPFVAAFQERLDRATARLNFGSSATGTPAPGQTRESAE